MILMHHANKKIILQKRMKMRISRTLIKSGWCPRIIMSALLVAVAGCATTDKAPEPLTKEELVWPLPPEQPRITYLKSLSSDRDVEATKSGSEQLKDSLLGKDGKVRRLGKPYGVHADQEGRVFVTDTSFGKLVVFDAKNKKFSIWGEAGKGILGKPLGVTSDSQGRVYVTDVNLKRVVVYGPDGDFLHAIGKKGEFEGPAGIAVNEKIGRIYVVDTKKHHIAVFNMEGELVSTIGERGTEPGQFNFPTNLAMGQGGKLYVMDTMNFRVQILDSGGKVLKTFGNIGDGQGQFARPKGIAVDSEGNIYVVDAAFGNFQIFNPEGQLLLFVGSVGREPGQFWLPAGAYIDKQDRLYIADQYNLRVQVFQYLKDQHLEDVPAQVQPEQGQETEQLNGSVKRHEEQERNG
jgi:DNA-binding beta-propeller fold protein YncE